VSTAESHRYFGHCRVELEFGLLRKQRVSYGPTRNIPDEPSVGHVETKPLSGALKVLLEPEKLFVRFESAARGLLVRCRPASLPEPFLPGMHPFRILEKTLWRSAGITCGRMAWREDLDFLVWILPSCDDPSAQHLGLRRAGIRRRPANAQHQVVVAAVGGGHAAERHAPMVRQICQCEHAGTVFQTSANGRRGRSLPNELENTDNPLAGDGLQVGREPTRAFSLAVAACARLCGRHRLVVPWHGGLPKRALILPRAGRG